jgi:polyhydroxyalkanoate synthesis regulator phasin
MKENIESFKIMLTELESSKELNYIRKNKIDELQKEIDELKRQNICLKNDLISISSLIILK